MMYFECLAAPNLNTGEPVLSLRVSCEHIRHEHVRRVLALAMQLALSYWTVVANHVLNILYHFANRLIRLLSRDVLVHSRLCGCAIPRPYQSQIHPALE